jgi:hypothetical protein
MLLALPAQAQTEKPTLAREDGTSVTYRLRTIRPTRTCCGRTRGPFPQRAGQPSSSSCTCPTATSAGRAAFNAAPALKSWPPSENAGDDEFKRVFAEYFDPNSAAEIVVDNRSL